MGGVYMFEIIDYEFLRGDTKKLEKFRPTDAEKKPLILSSTDQLYFTMKTLKNEVVIKKKKNNGIDLESDGFYHITLQPEDTEELNPGTYKYDIELDLDLEPIYVQTIIKGEIKLKEDITTKEDKKDE